ncbi:MAG: TIGR00341 family protein [Armatimonadetes bacterium 55-13]|nr:TIGR00341 family protein [Armatimonadota bacterium]OJU65100.1 MAG: TIGR00341 family protein [Armatimonadetes bacterium 55-13]
MGSGLDAGLVRDKEHEEPEEERDARSEVRRQIAESSRLTVSYIVMNSLATIVAGYGLLANSTAVVIGAMIIAMLLGPITGLALALVDGNTRLLRWALGSEIAGVILVLVISYFIGMIHADMPLTAEILARTKPNLLDLIIALAGGAAGAYAVVSPKVSVGLVGVAISTALVPPLTTCGICLARGQMGLASGGFLLFLTNLVAIQCASSAVMYAHGFHRITRRPIGDSKYIGRLATSVGILLVLSVVLGINLASTLARERFEQSVKDKLEAGLRPISGTYLVELRFVPETDLQIIVAVVRAPNSVTPDQTKSLEATLKGLSRDPIELHVRTVLTKETTDNGYLHEIAPEAAPVDDPTFKELPETTSVDGETTAPPQSHGGGSGPRPSETGGTTPTATQSGE